MKTSRKSGAYRLLVTMAIVIMLIIVLAEVVWIIRNSNSDTKTDGTDLTADQTADQTGTDQSGEQAAEADLAAEWNTKVEAAIKEYDTYDGENATRIPVLTYHRILADAEKKTAEYKNDRYAISVKEFDKQMKWLKKKRYKAITCEELYLWRTGKIKLPKRSVLITIDDGHAESIENAVRVFKKYKLKGTAFIVGKPAYESNGSYTITYSRIQTLRRTNPGQIEFQSHTYNIHRPNAYLTETYQAVMNDAAAQKEMYGFTYLAYPHGKYSAQMISAYKNSGIKMAFLFGKSGYATRKQDLYQMKRIEVTGNMKLRKFKRWCK